MREGCPPPDEILLAEGPAADHPLRDHLAACSRCRALLAARERFLADLPPDDEAEAERLEDGDRRLEAFIARVTARAGADAADGTAGGAVPVRDSGRRRSAGWPVGLASLVALAASLLLLVQRQEPTVGDGGPPASIPATETLWRGGGAESPPRAAPTAVPLPGGGWELSWEPVAGADRYEIAVLAEDLAELARLDAGAGTVLTLGADVSGGGGDAAFFVVTAYAAGEEVDHVEPVRLP